MRRLILIPMLALICASGVAQRSFPGAHFGGRFAPHHGGHYRGWSGYPLGPLYWDSLFSDDSLDSESSPPSVIVIQQPAAPEKMAYAPEASRPSPSLLIEFRDGRYVQVEGPGTPRPETPTSAPHWIFSQAYTSEVSHASSAPLPSTLLVFRDGSREQISNYTIADGVLYACANYYTEGSWNQSIALSSLDLSATVTENRARGVQFQIPAAPNQVIVGP